VATILMLIAGWYLILPLIVWGKLPKGGGWRTEPYDAGRHRIPTATSEFLQHNVASLVALGFRQAGDLVHRGTMTDTRLALLAHPDGVVATVAVFSTKTGQRTPMVEFTAQFANGTVLDVNNAPSVSVFAHRADHIVHRFPDVFDPTRLYRVYQGILERDFHAPALTRPDVSDPVRFVKESTEREYRRQVTTGYYRFEESSGLYATTLKGAYLMAWKLMVPFKQIRALLMADRSRKTLRALGMDAEGRGAGATTVASD